MVESMVTFEHRVPKISTNLARGMDVVGVLFIASWSATLLSSVVAPRTAAMPTLWSLATMVVEVHIVDDRICIYECSVCCAPCTHQMLASVRRDRPKRLVLFEYWSMWPMSRNQNPILPACRWRLVHPPEVGQLRQECLPATWPCRSSRSQCCPSCESSRVESWSTSPLLWIKHGPKCLPYPVRGCVEKHLQEARSQREMRKSAQNELILQQPGLVHRISDLLCTGLSSQWWSSQDTWQSHQHSPLAPGTSSMEGI